MKFEINKTISYFEVNAGFKLKLLSLFRYLQDAAIMHSDHSGLGIQHIRKNSVAWIISKIGVEIFRYPDLEESVRIVTWVSRLDRFKLYREFEVYAGDEKVAHGTSLWLYFNLISRILRRIPEEYSEKFGTESEKVMRLDLDRWRPNKKGQPDYTKEITVRISDFDTNNHINNPIYVSFIETLIYQRFQKIPSIKKIVIQYLKEIDLSKTILTAGLITTNTSHQIQLYDQQDLYLAGEIEPFEVEKNVEISYRKS